MYFLFFLPCNSLAVMKQFQLFITSYVTLHEKTKHNASKIIFLLRRPLPTTTFELLLLQSLKSLARAVAEIQYAKYTRIDRTQLLPENALNPTMHWKPRTLWPDVNPFYDVHTARASPIAITLSSRLWSVHGRRVGREQPHCNQQHTLLTQGTVH